METARDLGGTRLELMLGNIVEQATDAVVNAANRSLLGGGGVDGAIHGAGGPAILEECRRLGGCETGDAKLTGGGRLPARYVIHAVGPFWSGGDRGEDALLARAYRRCLEIAREHGLRSIAFPSISTGAYRFPVDAAAAIALHTVRDVIGEQPGAFDLVRFVLFSVTDLRVYAAALDAL